MLHVGATRGSEKEVNMIDYTGWQFRSTAHGPTPTHQTPMCQSRCTAGMAPAVAEFADCDANGSQLRRRAVEPSDSPDRSIRILVKERFATSVLCLVELI